MFNPFLLLLGSEILKDKPDWEDRTMQACLRFEKDRCVENAVAALIFNGSGIDPSVVERLRPIVSEDQLKQYIEKANDLKSAADLYDVSDAKTVIPQQIRRLNGES